MADCADSGRRLRDQRVPGAIGIDRNPASRADVLCDVAQLPYPFGDSSNRIGEAEIGSRLAEGGSANTRASIYYALCWAGAEWCRSRSASPVAAKRPA